MPSVGTAAIELHGISPESYSRSLSWGGLGTCSILSLILPELKWPWSWLWCHQGLPCCCCHQMLSSCAHVLPPPLLNSLLPHRC